MPPSQTPMTRLAQRAEDRLDELVTTIVAGLRAQVPGYGPDDGLSEADISEVLRGYLLHVLATLRGDPNQQGRRVDALMRSRAEAGITLAAMLHSYRVGLSALWQALATAAADEPDGDQALIAVTPMIFELLDEFSLQANEVHTALAIREARRLEQIRATRLDTILQVSPAIGPGFWDAAARLGIPREGNFIVIEATTADNHVPDIEQTLRAQTAVEDLWLRTGPTMQTGIVAFSERNPDIDRTLTRVLRGSRMHLGASIPFIAIGAVGRAAAQAHVARSATSPRNAYVRYNRDLLPVLLASTPAAAETLANETLAPVLALPEPRRVAMLETVMAWLANGQSVNAAADALHVHRNTVNYRLQRFQEIAGGRFTEPAWTAQVLLALEALEQLGLVDLHASSGPAPGPAV